MGDRGRVPRGLVRLMRAFALVKSWVSFTRLAVRTSYSVSAGAMAEGPSPKKMKLDSEGSGEENDVENRSGLDAEASKVRHFF